MKVAWSTKVKRSVLAADYDQAEHGMVQCIDEKCRVSVIVNRGNSDIAPHFKTTGYADSQHKPECGFFQKLDPIEALEKANEYRTIMASTQLDEDEYVIDLNLGRIDPDRTYLSDDENEKKPTKKKEKPEEEEVGEDNKKITKCTSPKSIVKLLTKLTPDELTNIYFSVKRGPKRVKLPLSELVITPDVAYRYVTENNDTGEYFVLGRVKHVNRREKVIFINLYPVNGIDFTLVVFQAHFPYFTYTNEQLVDKHCVIYGKLRKNQQRESHAEMVIKSNDYIAAFRKRKQVGEQMEPTDRSDG
ncbi:hypothetical protein P9G84_13705 [Brevibacillus centrosporus]|uniref:hypothetical protein n=1 Tax=Brevibacillus centrosporus TaxID=54910 RepID=UPI0011415811|nr:hypothetical protein [Brevibacillus centrosporus]MEC2129998.1 hypothetical protein [Brevibacillus centrosporus]GED32376.1 hypothetical protein BCE02nite_35170 [Brevibacillus centrosporus]